MYRFLTYLLCLLPLPLMAAETIVVGTVRDASTGLPVENVNLWYRNTSVGCATNSEGLFMLRTDLTRKRTLVVSALGYRKQHYTIEPGQYAGIEIELEEESTFLQDVFITPGENPALPLMEKVRSRRLLNDMLLNPSVSYSRSERKDLFISDIRQKHLQRLVWKSLRDGMFTAEDSTLLLPLYSSRTVSSMHAGVREPLVPAEERSVLLTETDYSLLLEGLPEHFDFYRNTVSVFSHNFISPLAASGNNHYTYWLADSLMLPCSEVDSVGSKAYIVHFRSRNPYEPSFNGEMTIDSASCGVRSIEVSVPREVSVNYLTSLRVRQSYDSQLMPVSEDMSMIFDFAIKADTSHVFPTVLLRRSNATIAADVVADAGSVPLSSADSAFSAAADTAFQRLQQTPLIRFGKFLGHIITTGNIPTGEKVEIGNIVELLGYSREEGFHLGIPLTTTERLWKRVELSGYVAYGFGDRALKGKGQIRALLPTPRRNLIGVSYWDHYALTDVSMLDCFLRENSVFYGDHDLAHLIFGNISYSKQYIPSTTRRREFTLWTENDLSDNIETVFALRMGRMGYGSPFVGYRNIPSFRFRTLQATMRVGFKERKADIYMRRVHVHSGYPILRLSLEAGSWQFDKHGDAAAFNLSPESTGAAGLYARIALQVQQTVSLGMLGRLDYAVQAGIILGKMPYPLLEVFTGNMSVTYDPYRFTLMNPCQYAADKFVCAHLHWNMQGAVFNRIPYLQRLHLRELVEVKFAYGSLDDKHNSVISLPESMRGMSVPYVEAGVGIGNILRVADLYAVFRLTDFKNTTTPWWAIRARFSLGL